MKSSTGELLDMHEGEGPQEHRGYTGALELYDELINFLGLAGVKRPTNSPQPAAVASAGYFSSKLSKSVAALLRYFSRSRCAWSRSGW